MTEETALDRAFAAMEAAPDDDAVRLAYHERLADGELFVLLAQEAEGDQIVPELFDLGEAQFVLVFDREERLSGFAGGPAAYAALSGRTVVEMLAGQGIGLAVNLGTASENALPPETVDWLQGTLAQGPREDEARAEEVHPPRGLPESLVTALDGKLARAAGLARKAYLAGVT